MVRWERAGRLVSHLKEILEARCRPCFQLILDRERAGHVHAPRAGPCGASHLIRSLPATSCPKDTDARLAFYPRYDEGREAIREASKRLARNSFGGWQRFLLRGSCQDPALRWIRVQRNHKSVYCNYSWCSLSRLVRHSRSPTILYTLQYASPSPED